MAIKNQEALDERANNLEAQGLNGFRFVVVYLSPASNPTEAHLEVYFNNNHEIANILNSPEDPRQIFPVSGGHRKLAGPASGQVKVTAITDRPDDKVLMLTVTPIGDYSTYTLGIDFPNMDPIFSELPFKFRPGCFNLCTPEWQTPPKPKQDPVIDYLAKDYDSFKHTMITVMMERVSGWEPTSEADVDQVLLELFSAAADELSDYQDRVMNEAYLGTARKRVSLARHARLMDYHIHQGNQASTWLGLKVTQGTALDLPEKFIAWSGNDIENAPSVVFMTRRQQHLHHLLNDIGLYTWSGSIPSLAAGSTSADLKLSDNGQIPVNTVRDLIHDGTITHLMIQEHLNPATGREAGRYPGKRQLLRLLPGEPGAESIQDPLTETWILRVHWQEKDKLKYNYCFTVDCSEGLVKNVSLFHGNLMPVYQGRPFTVIFKEPGEILSSPNEYHFERTERWGTLCRLPENPLAYRDTLPGGEIPPVSTLEVEIDGDQWDEVIDLIHSDDSDEQGDHFIVETDELRQSTIRFGNGTNGKQVPDGAEIYCFYQIGHGPDGNIGADKLTHFDNANFPEIEFCWNPFDVTNGRDRESREEFIRRIPEAYRLRQLRAITLKDYIDRAEELAEVSRASARYGWTGSWRSVRIAIDPVGTTELEDDLRRKIAGHLDAVRLIGDDLEIRPPRFIPLEIHVNLCIHPGYWPEDIREILEQEFSDGFTPDGRMAFFHPDRWTFGKALRASQIIGRVQSVKGVDHVTSLGMRRWNAVTPGTADIIEVRTNEIIQVKNNPDHLEEGFIFFNIKGGRQ